jgi:hypothetical protein
MTPATDAQVIAGAVVLAIWLAGLVGASAVTAWLKQF